MVGAEVEGHFTVPEVTAIAVEQVCCSMVDLLHA